VGGRSTRILKTAAWLSAALLAVLSLIPGDAQVRTPAPKEIEHFVAYAGTAALFAAAYGRRALVPVLAALGAAAIGFEGLQTFIPGRGAHVSDAVASALGALAGWPAGALGRRLLAGRRRPGDVRRTG
jgi:VanZ family protein